MLSRFAGLATAAAISTACAPAATRTSGLSEADLAQAALADSVRRSYTQADIDFMTGMIHHHAQALVMSNRSDALNGLADRIRGATPGADASKVGTLADAVAALAAAGG